MQIDNAGSIKVPKILSTLEINGNSIRFNFTDRKPHLWWRFWQWVLLGWRWCGP